MPHRIKIGVFDSGVGGLSVAKAIRQALPGHEVIYRDDSEHVPYGTRSIEEIHSFTKPILEEMVKEGCKVIVIACNTVTTNMIKRLREEINVPLIGMEPMVKPAALATSTDVIAVCATPRTLSSKRYRWLKEEYARGIKVLEPDCSDWAFMIEVDIPEREKIAKIVEDVCSEGADQIVLGCTHYHWIEEEIKKMSKGRAQVLQPEGPVIEQLKRVLNAPTTEQLA
jgi:glutamate racemase